MQAGPDDWRRRGQEEYLKGARLTWKHYQALRPEWEHEHCEFCFRKFLDRNYSPLHRRALDEHPDDNAAAGFTTIGYGNTEAGASWICKECFDDFVDEFEWVVVESDPEAWPYGSPEPSPRPSRMAEHHVDLDGWRRWWERQGERELRDLLMLWWDPIGVYGITEALDEYDDVVLQLGRRLREGATQDEVDAFLASQDFGITVSKEQVVIAAAKVSEWFDRSMEKLSRGGGPVAEQDFLT